ncbi:MAG: ABC transporter ATP-binding protein [Eubacteriales bacterium]|jgi:ATP-binding cassette subfamily B protein|nr:ABC transporter ATP-binding protein [Eubacteriales bacterium]MDD4105269.1 ABC transporter ATP-binding protein [Eubacteriales bacterium]MDD4710526.1 ABC transporter ATP-binding protein [Eubacteriales bacterium]
MQYQEEQEYTKTIKLKTWKNLLKYVKQFRGKFALVAGFMTTLAVSDVILPLMTRYGIDTFVVPRTAEGLTPFIMAYALLLIVQIAAIFFFIYFASRVEYGICYAIRREGFRKLQELPFSYYDRMPVGYLMSRMTSDARHLGEAFGWGLVDLVWAVVYLSATIVSMTIINWQLTLMILLVLPPLAAVSIYFQKRILASHRDVRKTNSRITGSFNEGIMGAKTTKTLVREEENFQEFSTITSHMKKISIRSASLSAIYLPLVISIGSIATAYLLTEGSHLVLAGAMSLGTVTAFFSYTVNLFEPIHNIAATFAEMQRMQAAAERVLSLLETEPDIQDTKAVENEFGDNFNPKKENWPGIRGEVDFENVTFKYKDGETVLKNFNLHVNVGETIALAGPTGAGKSTIVNLICRFYEPTEGMIKIDGVDYCERSQLWLQSNIGYVLQEPHLFSGPIRDNIRYARKGATDEEVRAAARLVNAEEFILRLENGYDTDVGEGGNRLSTGEKQLISFARAILNNPRIFVLDEATSSVDTETEALIQRAIEKTLEGRTSFIIAHRLSTIRSADRILVIQDGEVTESGTHDKLMQLGGFYHTLYTNQFKEEESRALLDTEA